VGLVYPLTRVTTPTVASITPGRQRSGLRSPKRSERAERRRLRDSNKWRTGRLTEAEESLKKAVEIEPTSVAANRALANIPKAASSEPSNAPNDQMRT
jgi:hypothetical protein